MAALHMSSFLKNLGLFVYKLLVFDLDNDKHKVHMCCNKHYNSPLSGSLIVWKSK